MATDRILEEQSLGPQKVPRGYTETKMVNLKTMLRNAKRDYAVQSNMDSRIWHSHITKLDIKSNPPHVHIHLYKIFYLTKFQSSRKNLGDQFGLPKRYLQLSTSLKDKFWGENWPSGMLMEDRQRSKEWGKVIMGGRVLALKYGLNEGTLDTVKTRVFNL